MLRTQATEQLETGCTTLQATDKRLFKYEDKIANFNLMDLKQWLQEVSLACEAANYEFIQRQRSLSHARVFMGDWLNTTQANAS